jgi:hypothetical protein
LWAWHFLVELYEEGCGLAVVCCCPDDMPSANAHVLITGRAADFVLDGVTTIFGVL